MFDLFFDLPVHPLVVHATVVVPPIAAVAVLLAAVWPGFRQRAGILPLLLSGVSLVLVPITVRSGQALAERVEETAMVTAHQDRGESLLPWVIALTVVAALQYWLGIVRSRGRWSIAHPRAFRWIVITLTVLAVASAAATAVQVIRVGHSGATAAWSAAV